MCRVPLRAAVRGTAGAVRRARRGGQGAGARGRRDDEGAAQEGPRGAQAAQAALEVAQVERRVVLKLAYGRRVEGRVDAVERGAVAVVGALDGGSALRQRPAGHLHAAEAKTRALGLLEETEVDLDAEDLVHAAHVATPRRLVVVQVEKPATGVEAMRHLHHPVAERTALAALVSFDRPCCWCVLHGASLARAGRSI